jgi:hypothetical protein
LELQANSHCRSVSLDPGDPAQALEACAAARANACNDLMDWHIINHRDYIDGPFETYEAALREACALGKETRMEPRVRRRAQGFFVYRPPYDRQERWQAEYWICTKEAAIAQGIPEEIFVQPLTETWA